MGITKSVISVCCLLCAVLVGCAATPQPTDLLNDAEIAIDRAQSAGAVEYAPLELRFAREKLAAAKLAIEQRKHDIAIWLADESVVNSELALAKTAAARARDAARRQREANERLRAELDRTGSEGGL